MGNTDVKHVSRTGLGVERRVTPRFDCDRGVQFWRDGSHSPLWGEFVDIGMTGCAIHSPTQLSPGSRMRMTFTLFGATIRCAGEVKTSRDGVMGVLFTSVLPAEQQKLRAAVQRLADGGESGAEAVVQAQQAVARLQRWFKQHDLLSREMFQSLLQGEHEPASDASSIVRLNEKLAECRFRL